VTDLVVIVPSRGRPGAARELVEAFAATRTVAHLVFAIDDDDPTGPEYYRQFGGPDSTVDTGSAPSTMVRALNASAIARASAANPPFAFGFMGDDHRPRTVGWDARYLEALRELGTGIVYGDDLLQGERIPTQVAMTSDIVRSLGWMAPPVLTHLYVDNFWRDLGVAAGCIRYLPDVVVEHMHPIAGKADWDEGHQRVNAPEMYHADRAAYGRFIEAGGLTAAVETVKALRADS
jgi:hypothetical protein